ncbi:MAG TPA: serine/threonine protein kinase [Nannocystis exedens]|nr:serine/threonine protein kinase [Nannocystis exedens]
MELRNLGTFRLVQPLKARSTSYRMVLARHENDPEDLPPAYVVKILMPGSGDEHKLLRANFDHEIELLRRFNHPSIPSAHGEGEQDGARYVIMDYIDGIDLAGLLGHDGDQPRGLSKEMAVYIMGQLADALDYMHNYADPAPDPKGGKDGGNGTSGKKTALHILHRDIAPSNILLSRTGNVLLCDFNTASSRLLPPEFDTVHAGTRAYMAPERIVAAAPATEKTDLFAMAVVLWEILKGKRCFKAEDDLRTIDAIVRFEITHPTKRVSGLSPKLSEIVRRNLDRDPGRRYTGARQMLQRLAQAPEAAAAERSRSLLAELVTQAANSRAAAWARSKS